MLLVFAGVGAYGLTDGPAASGPGAAEPVELAERWISSLPEALESNHHSPAAVAIDGESYIAVPINSRQGTVCRMSVLDGDGEERWADTLSEADCNVHSISDPTIADYDRDGEPEILAATSAREFVAYSLDGRVELRRNLTSFGYSTPVVADLTGDETPETVVVDLLGGVSVFRPDGSRVWNRDVGDARVRQPRVEDFDADGDPELAVGKTGGSVVMLNGDGSTRWQRNLSDALTLRWIVPAQIDDDPAVELVAAGFSGNVYAIDGRTGETQWRRGFDARGTSVYAVGDGDDDGVPEAYVAARDGKVRSLNARNGSVEWTTTLTLEPVAPMPPPSLGDLNGDGSLELVAPSNTGSVSVLDPTTGELIDSYSREEKINTFVPLVDFDGDGDPEALVIYNDGRVAALDA
ncbi:hypothetical protein JCM30237_03800 [Halolamina litorea]